MSWQLKAGILGIWTLFTFWSGTQQNNTDLRTLEIHIEQMESKLQNCENYLTKVGR